jgi:hypothetical protein
MRQLDRRLDPIEAIPSEWQRAEERRGSGERMDRRADIVNEARQRQICRAHAAANRRLRFIDDNLSSRLTDDDRSSEAIGAGADVTASG